MKNKVLLFIHPLLFLYFTKILFINPLCHFKDFILPGEEDQANGSLYEVEYTRTSRHSIIRYEKSSFIFYTSLFLAQKINKMFPLLPQVFLHDFHPTPNFFHDLAQIHALYDADRSSAALCASSALVTIKQA